MLKNGKSPIGVITSQEVEIWKTFLIISGKQPKANHRDPKKKAAKGGEPEHK